MTSERKPRKSVAFSEGTTIVDSNGEVTETNGTSDKTSAESHSAGTSQTSNCGYKRDGHELSTEIRSRKF